MRHYAYRLLNVFSESTFDGNPLCVFEDGTGLSDAEMQLLARQFNLSETTFLLPSEVADRRVRVFTPGAEMRFAGHPAIGSAHVVRALGADASNMDTAAPADSASAWHGAEPSRDAITLAFAAGVVPLTAFGDVWTFIAPAPGGVKARSAGIDRMTVAAWFGLAADDLAGDPMWVDTGSDQLLIPLAHADAVTRARPDARLISEWPTSSVGRRTAYLFEVPSDSAEMGGGVGASRVAATVRVRYFFAPPAGGVAEDPGTGSACANLGGWWQATQRPLPMHATVIQGVEMQRTCHLQLQVDQAGAIHVGGRAREIGRGTLTL
ncbi:PhzF family phenazine biosynthesis protein [Schauerella aestuarii]|uniref:PhzF family phenazine biosynthesis protein n=1 Tax=Schauerella aestuarii TaxID=2511204 RepID=UPI00136CA73A|nr:PhzF family phenazine biosynthesis protein [Achromobacter aestuarii]MYZ43189.1 PhzF family phenazine biosynthesis protein [Achromobacter aestuarii]